MTTQTNRRRFIRSSAIAGCTIIAAGKLTAFSFPQDEVPDPKKLNYCGYTCPKDCQFLEASVKNDSELKMKAYETWKIKERYNIDFDAEKIFCFGCKNTEDPAGVVMLNCTVRQCAIGKNLDACIECNNLKICDKDLWSRFPEFHQSVIKMQASYEESKS
jgi:hypothetical protein